MDKITSLFLVTAVLATSSQSLASGCFSESFYNTEELAQQHNAPNGCYYDELKPIKNPKTMADRQYNYFSAKLNEYVSVLGIEAVDKKDFEFMFYPKTVQNALAKEDRRQVNFNYEQTFTCYAGSLQKKVKSQIYVYGTVGLTGVCLRKKKVSAW